MTISARRYVVGIVAVAWLGAAASSAAAQYDRDGRYVPSPMGVPADPYARPVPMFPGSPGGGAIGTPDLPRSAFPEPARPPPRTPSVSTEPLRPTEVPLTLEQCKDGWSRKTLATPTEFRRYCALLVKRQEKLDEEQGVKKTGPPDKVSDRRRVSAPSSSRR